MGCAVWPVGLVRRSTARSEAQRRRGHRSERAEAADEGGLRRHATHIHHDIHQVRASRSPRCTHTCAHALQLFASVRCGLAAQDSSLCRGLVLDATVRGGLARFINHSCGPNCETQKWIVKGETRVGIFARRRIEAGEELTYDYQLQWNGTTQVRCTPATWRHLAAPRPLALCLAGTQAFCLALCGLTRAR